MIPNTDIDIDLADRERLLSLVKHIPAMMEKDKKHLKHNVGVYFHHVPKNPETDLCSITYKEAEDRGFFKIDLLNVHLYKKIKSDDHLNKLLNEEPQWELLQYRDFVEGEPIWHLEKHFSVLSQMKPKSIVQLAMILGMIRPAKRHLLGKSWKEIEKEIWIKPDDRIDEKIRNSFFKKPHAIAYAHLIVVQMNLIVEELA